MNSPKNPIILYLRKRKSAEDIHLLQFALDRLGHRYTEVTNERIVLEELPGSTQIVRLKAVLYDMGYDIFVNKKELICQDIRNAIEEMIEEESEMSRIKVSHLLQKKLGYDYAYLSNIFSKSTGVSIKKYVVLRRLERVKGLISGANLSLKEISCRLRYSSTAHLSAQFKQFVGVTPTQFRRQNGIA